MKTFNIDPINQDIIAELEHKINFKTKPLGALGMLESVALKIGQIQQTVTPKIVKPHIIVFAGDHGLANDGVSAYPQEVTHQMVLNFLSGGAAINVFCNQNNITLKVIDAGVNHQFDTMPNLINAKVGMGTKSALTNSAMTIDEVSSCLELGASSVNNAVDSDCNIIGFGEMGIGNTSSASLIMHYLTKQSIVDCVGKGTGVNDEQLLTKLNVLKSVISFHGDLNNPLDILAAVGGFEMAQMVGAYLQAAENKMTILVDGFITTAAFALACVIEPNVKEYAIFSHQSEEKGHQSFLNYLNVTPLLSLGLRLGEGTGCALVLPLIQSSVNFLTEMSSFESAGVSNK
jgi:nicotinate-nucleotide--dimethylbenzimidazole phosphoribosyltransferase